MKFLLSIASYLDGFITTSSSVNIPITKNSTIVVPRPSRPFAKRIIFPATSKRELVPKLTNFANQKSLLSERPVEVNDKLILGISIFKPSLQVGSHHRFS